MFLPQEKLSGSRKIFHQTRFLSQMYMKSPSLTNIPRFHQLLKLFYRHSLTFLVKKL